MAVEWAHLKAAISIFFLLSLALSDALPQAQAYITTQTRYCGAMAIYSSDMTSYSYIFGFMQWNTEGAYDYNNQTLISTNRYFQWGIRAYTIDENDSETQLTMAVSAIVQRNNGEIAEGYQSATWNFTGANITRSSRLVIKFYQRYSIVYPTTWAPWTQILTAFNYLSPTFLGDALGVAKLAPSLWNVTQYTFRLNNGKSFGIYFGDNAHNARIENIALNDEKGGFSRGFVLAFVVGLAVCVILLGIGAKKLRSG